MTDEIMILPTLLDTETGEVRKLDERWRASLYWWAEGNGCCDCNRELAMGIDDHTGTCKGCERFRIVDIDGDFSESEKAAIMAELDTDYR